MKLSLLSKTSFPRHILKYIEVVAAVIKDDDKFLCAQRKDNKFEYLAYKFEFPGGKVENNESLEACLYREIKEELDAPIHSLKFLMDVYHEYPDFNVHLHFFECSTLKSKIKLLEHNSIKWCSLNELKNLDWAEADLPVVECLSKKYDI